MIKSVVNKIAALSGADGREAALLMLLSAGGWLYFAYSYLYESGLGLAVPRYAGY